MALKRLGKELKDLQNERPDWLIEVGPMNDDMMHWNATFTAPDTITVKGGEAESPYKGGHFHVELEFPADYPFKCPGVKFMTKIYNPNIKSDGEMCIDGIVDAWSPAMTVKKFLETVRLNMLGDLSNAAVEPDVAQHINDDLEGFLSKAREWTAQYAQP